MSPYIPNGDPERREMLAALGFGNTEEYFASIPPSLRLEKPLELPPALSEMELAAHMETLADRNRDMHHCISFLGAGVYDHFIPAAVGHIVNRSEFYTAYTPYQPEISQGTLQAIFEYQTFVCELTGMQASNASLYDGATAFAEAALLACRATRRNKILALPGLHPHVREVLATYGRFCGFNIETIPLDIEKGCTAGGAIPDDTAAVLVSSPNFYGIIEDIAPLAEKAHEAGALLVAGAGPIALALMKPPGEAGADICVGEGQALGNTPSFGGPLLGFFAVKEKYLRQMPGRVIGETHDREGRTAYVMTLQTREQHIRREKATSNICSNQALNALAAAAYMTLMGPAGLKRVAELCLQKSHYAYAQLLKIPEVSAPFKGPFFKEFAVSLPLPPAQVNGALMHNGIIGGYALPDGPIKNGWLVAVTEKRTKAEIDEMVRVVKEALI
jgi:glycine dehydrogenase subunit 1